MGTNQNKFVKSSILLLSMSLAYGPALYAANAINLRHQQPAAFSFLKAEPIKMNEISRNVDLNNTTHIRMFETYNGYRVLGGEGIVHVKSNAKLSASKLENVLSAKDSNITMNGTMYDNLNEDLDKAPSHIFTTANAEKAYQQALTLYQNQVSRTVQTKDLNVDLVVYVDKSNKAHWAYRIRFYVEPLTATGLPAKPGFLLDAVTFDSYQQWDDIQTAGKKSPKTADAADGGGFGGNKKMGKRIYDGLTVKNHASLDHFAKLGVMRDASAKNCQLTNDDVTVKHYNSRDIVAYDCEKIAKVHNNTYWDGALHGVNDGFSPDNDALWGGAIIKDMYQKWYGVPVLKDSSGKPMMLTMVVHARMDNAYWDGRQMTFGDGISMFYPLTSLGVAAHEISHGFTSQHSNLAYYGQSGGMNEAFSDMAAQAAEFYAYGKNSWQIGPEIFKAENEALRYMDQPSKDCKGKKPGTWCSIDEVSQYKDGLDVHFSSGIYNRAFYGMGTAKGWDPKKAFEVMVKANSDYWTAHVDFKDGACGVIDAAKDLKYDTAAVKEAFKVVGISTEDC